MSDLTTLLLFVSLFMLSYVVLCQCHVWISHGINKLTVHIDDVFQSLYIFANASHWVLGYAVFTSSLLLLLVVLTHNPVLVAGLIATAILLPIAVLRHLRLARQHKIAQSLPDALLQIAASLRAGSGFVTAVQMYVAQQRGPLAQEFSLMLRELRVGIRFDGALENLGERVQSEDLDLLVSAVMISNDVGGNLAGILQELSGTIRNKLMLEGKMKTLTAQGKLQALVISALPVAVLLALVVMEPEATLPIFHGLLGWACLSVMLVMQIAGALMIGRIVRVKL